MAIMWPTPAKDSLRYYGYPEATDPALFTKSVEALHQSESRFRALVERSCDALIMVGADGAIDNAVLIPWPDPTRAAADAE